jgi:predicted amidohydrolase YtcJ
MQPDVILIGGIIHTIDPTRRHATALAISGDRIIAVGDDATIAALAGPAGAADRTGRPHDSKII